MSTDNDRGRSDTNFTNLTFDDIKQSLISKAKLYYPDAYKDFSASSFGGMMIDLVSMVSEQLNFYAQFIANENFAETSRTTYALKTQGDKVGQKINNKYTSTAMMSLFTYIPASMIGSMPDKKYSHRILAGAKMVNNLGSVFTTIQDAVVSLDKKNFVGTHFSTDGSKNTYYTYETKVMAISGEEKEVNIEIGNSQKFLRVDLKTLATDILSVVDASGNQYYEVDNLSQNMIFRSISDRSNSDPLRPELVAPFPVPRRFVVEDDGERTFLVFGFGSQKNLQKKPIADPSEISLKMTGKNHIPDVVFDPSRLFESDGFGIAPQNTTLTVRYRSNTTENSNSAIDTVNQLVSAELVFDDASGLEEQKLNYIKNISNISCTNKEPFNGALTFTTKKEIVETISAAKGLQGRAVTSKDYAAASYLLPPKYGSIKRASLVKDDNDFRRNLNIYVVSEDSSKKLQTSSKALKQNLKTWLNQVRMVSDSIDVFDAKIINLGLVFDIVSSERANKATVLSGIREALFDELTLGTPEIGQHFSIGEVERILNSMKQVLRVNLVKVVLKMGENYSGIRHDIPSNVSPDGSLVYIPKDCIWEIKFVEDIIGKIQ